MNNAVLYLYSIKLGTLCLECTITNVKQHPIDKNNVLGTIVKIHKQQGFYWLKPNTEESFEKDQLTEIVNPNELLKKIV